MINESLKNAFKEMWKKNLNLLDISKSDLNSHISNDHPCYYAESALIGGPASSAVKLNSSAGDSNTPVYFSGGRPVACTSLDLNTSGNAATATALKNSGMLDTQEKIDGFIAANTIKYATFKTTDSNNVNMASNDGMIISIPWTSNSYGAQLAFDDTQDATIKVRGYSSSWGDWKTLLNSSNYTNYTVKKDGTGASGTWGIGISGNAATATALTTSAGSATQPIYFLNGKPVACTYTLGKSVPSNAEFTDTTYNNATTSTDGLMSSSDKIKLNGIAAGATKTTVDSALSSTSTNPVQNKVIYGAIASKADLDTSGKVLSSQLPSYVDDVLEYSAKSNFPSAGESGKIYVDTATNLTYRWSGSAYVEISQSLALGETSSTAYRGDRGKIAYDHSQTSHAPANAEVNQNAFSNVKVGSTTVSADSKTDTLELVAGTNVTLTPDATNDKVTITTNDTKNTAGSTNTSSKIFLVGATSLAANPQTYSHNTAYVGTDGCLYSNNTKVSVNGHTHNYIAISDTRNDNPAPNSASFIKFALSADFKYVNKINSPSGFSENYCGLINFAPWGETSGGNGYQIAVGYNTNAHPRLAVRSADLSATSWGSWYKIYTSDDKPTPADIGAAASSHTHTVANITNLTATATELNYCDGVTSNIQTQLNGKASSSHSHSASNITAGTLGGKVVANTSAVSDLIRKQLRNITISTALPTSSDGENGDIWLVY